MAVRIGMLGSGFVANFYQLGLRNLAGYELAAVCSPNKEHAQSFADKWGYADVLTDAEEMAKRGDKPGKYTVEQLMEMAQQALH